MGQTLTHGIYLPDEGERNCYDGLAANWQLLDNSVGTIAEHTSALAGKAPAVHTHTKSDVTDLLNSNFIPSANNTYDLGSSSYQWNNVYSKGYYYNGVAWGLDKANQWSSEQTCKSNNPKWINRNNNITLGVAPTSNQTSAFYNYDKNGNEIGRFVSRVQPDGKTITWLSAVNLYKNGAIDSTGSSVWANLYCAVDANGYPHVSTDCALTPNTNNYYDLGTSTNKWKSLNGINPGALSFPKVDGWNSGTEINENIGIDTTNWDMSGGTWNEMTNNALDGWVYFAFQGCAATDRAQVRYYGTNARYLTMAFNAYGSTGGGYYLYVAFPMAKGSTVNIAFITSGSIMSKFIYPCLGNV